MTNNLCFRYKYLHIDVQKFGELKQSAKKSKTLDRHGAKMNGFLST